MYASGRQYLNETLFDTSENYGKIFIKKQDKHLNNLSI